jgi:hypothetical protein
LIAITKAFQMIESETYIGPIKYKDPDYPILHRASEIPLEEEYLNKYMEEPTVNKDKSYSVRVYVHTNFELEHYKTKLAFINFLKDSNMVIEYNDLDTVNLLNVGFFENIIPRHDTCYLYQERLEKVLPDTIPRFQLSVQSLHAGRGLSSCKILMVKCDKQNINQLINEFDNLNRTGLWKFFPFNEFNVKTPGQKVTIIRQQVHWCTIYRSLILKGFNNNKDHIKMVHENNNDMNDIIDANKHYLLTTTWGDYLRKYVKTSSGEPLFEYVYPTIDGTREFIIAIQK